MKYLNEIKFPDDLENAESAINSILSHVSSDISSDRNLASFITTNMDSEAIELIKRFLPHNIVCEKAYPGIQIIHQACLKMLGDLFNGDTKHIVGTSTIGSSEAIMLAGLAMKKKWEKLSKRTNIDSKPNIIVSDCAHVCWEKFSYFFDVKIKSVPFHNKSADEINKMIEGHIDSNTIGVCAILGTTFTGMFDPIHYIHDAVANISAKINYKIPLHIDAASGGFYVPFIYPDMVWDFRLPFVSSINVSGHKYGLVYPGVGWILWRDKEQLDSNMLFELDYLGGNTTTISLNFSRPSSHIIAQYYNLIRYGRKGYTKIMNELKSVADYIADEISKIDTFNLLEAQQKIPIVVWGVKNEAIFTTHELSDLLKELGWVVPAYSLPPSFGQNRSILRVVVKVGFSMENAKKLVEDIKEGVVFFKNKYSL